MTPFRISLLTLALGAVLALAATAGAGEPAGPTAEQQKELDAAREDLHRAAKRLAELSGRYGTAGGHGFDFETLMPSRPVIGVLLAPEPQGGVRITGVTPDGAAAGAGIKSGDRLLRIDGKAITGDSAEDRVGNARKLLRDLDEKTAVTLAYARDGREHEVSVTPKRDGRVMLFVDENGRKGPGREIVVRTLGDGKLELDGETIDLDMADGAHWKGKPGEAHVFSFDTDGERGDGAPHVERRVIRIECKAGKDDCAKQAAAHAGAHIVVGGDADGDVMKRHQFILRGDCKAGDDCKENHLFAEAFRWSGLNLASVDARLGRYFGTDKGVLVLSTGPMLEQLQPGDVIQRVDGKPVSTPRAVMDALREKPADSTVAVDYLRDRNAGTVQLKVPKPASFPLLIDKVGAAGPHADRQVERTVVMIGADGKAQIVEHEGR